MRRMSAVALAHDVVGPADAPVLVLVGSLGSTRAMWDPQTRALGERFRLVRVDLRGHGDSPVVPGPCTMADHGADVLALLDRLGLARASFCGLSLGGMIGQWLGAHAPERIDRLVLCCTSAHMPPAEGWHERAATVRAAASVEPIADATIDRWLTPAFRAAHPGTAAKLRAMLAATPSEGYAGCCDGIAEMDQRPDLPAITAPTLVIAGADDPSTPPEHGEVIAEAIDDARLVVVEPAAHLASVERAEAVSELILAHLARPEEA